MPLKRPPEDLDLDSSSKQARRSDPDSPYNSSGESKASSEEEEASQPEEANQPDVVRSNDPDPIYNAPRLESWTDPASRDKSLPRYNVCIFKCIREMRTSLSLTNQEEAKEWLRIVCDRHYGINTNSFPGWYLNGLAATSRLICQHYSDFLHRHSNRDVLHSKCSRQLLLFILLQEDQRGRPAFSWIEAALGGFLRSEQVDRNLLIKTAQKGNGYEGDFGNRSGFYPRERCFFLCQRRDGEDPLVLHQNTGP